MAYLALSTGTTNCGPAIEEISLSTLEVLILKSPFASTRYEIDFKKFIYSSLLKSLPAFSLCQASIFF